MAKGIAILVGLKEVDPSTHVNGWDGKNGCGGCELDVDNVARIVSVMKYQSVILKTAQASHDNVLNALRSAVKSLGPGDILFFYFSGHGGQQPDKDDEELDGQDETLIAYDRDIVDDELNDIWLSAPIGLRIFMISDSCNSGTNYKFIGDFLAPTPFVPIVDAKIRSVMKAQMIHFGGCRDGSTSSGFEEGGALTTALCRTWNNGAFSGNYRVLLKKCAEMVLETQVPQYNEYGPVSDAFRLAKPFSI